jgi:hypothetical protein
VGRAYCTTWNHFRSSGNPGKVTVRLDPDDIKTVEKSIDYWAAATLK